MEGLNLYCQVCGIQKEHCTCQLPATPVVERKPFEPGRMVGDCDICPQRDDNFCSCFLSL